jgi:hypothetical protein
MSVDDCSEPSRRTLPEIFGLIRDSGRSGPDALHTLLRDELGLDPEQAAEVLRAFLAETR